METYIGIITWGLILLSLIVGLMILYHLVWRRKGQVARTLLIECLSQTRFEEEELQLEPFRVRLSKARGNYQRAFMAHKTLLRTLEQTNQPISSKSQQLTNLALEEGRAQEAVAALEVEYEQKLVKARAKAQAFAQEVVADALAPQFVVSGKETSYFLEWGTITLVIGLIALLAILEILEGKHVETLLTILLGYVFGRRGVLVSGIETKE